MTDKARWSPFVLLLVDAQYSFWPEVIAEAFPAFPDAVRRLLSTCRSVGIDVVHVRRGSREGYKAGALDYLKYPITVAGERFVEATNFRHLFGLEETFQSLRR